MKKLITTFAAAALVLFGTNLKAQQSAAPPRPPSPPASGPMLDLATSLAEAINKQDAEALQGMLAEDAVYLDEDGHAPPVARWISKLTTTQEGAAPKKIEISNTHSQMWNETGWVSFNYEIAEVYNGKPVTVRGTASMMAKKDGAGKWKVHLIHGALYQKVAGLTDAG